MRGYSERLSPLTFVVLFFSAQPVDAAEWSTSFGVAPQIAYTDNVCLDDGNKKSEWIGIVAPNLRLQGTGARASVSFNGSLRFNTLDNNDTQCENRGGNDAESPIPSGSFYATSELIRNLFFIDADASARQNSVNEFAGSGSDGLNRSGNLNTTTRYSVNPYIDRRLKDVAALNVSYLYDEQQNSENVVGDSTQQRADFSLDSLADTSLGWRVDGYWDEVDYDEQIDANRTDSELKAINLTLRYRLDRKWQLSGTIGNEDNDFVSERDDIDGDTWDVGVLWTPTTRTSLDVGLGDRFFGDAPRVNFTHRFKRSSILASYSKDITYSRELRGQGSTDSQQAGVGDDGQVIVEEGIDGLGIPTSLSRSPILNEQFLLNYSFQGRRSSYSVNASRSEQIRTDRNEESIFSSIFVGFDRSLGRKLDFSTSVRWDKREAEEARSVFADDSETWIYSMRLTRGLGNAARASLEYRYSDRDSDIARDSYEENRITATVNFSF